MEKEALNLLAPFDLSFENGTWRTSINCGGYKILSLLSQVEWKRKVKEVKELFEQWGLLSLRRRSYGWCDA